MRFGIDYAFDRPSSMRALQGAGVTFVVRYLAAGAGGSKELTAGEARALSAAGIDIALVWETSAGRASEGHDAGVRDASRALAQASGLGMPDGRPIYLAADDDFAGTTVASYYTGARKVLGSRLGAYGGYKVISYLLDHGLLGWAWQTYAWSASRLDHRAHLYQYSNGHTLAGVDCDYNHALKPDFGQWRIGWSPVWLRGGAHGPEVKRLVDKLMWLGFLPYPVLGRPRSKYGGWVNTAVKRFQHDYHLREDAVAGPATLEAIDHAVAARRRHGYRPRRRPPLAPWRPPPRRR